jgi:hypothetical protein
LISDSASYNALNLGEKTEQEICKEIANLHEYIIAAGVIENRQLAARFSKVGDPPAGEERLKILFAQPDIMLSIARTNEDFFGKLRFLILCFETSDIAFFPAYVRGTEKTLFIRMQRSFRGEEIVRKVYDYLEKKSP